MLAVMQSSTAKLANVRRFMVAFILIHTLSREEPGYEFSIS